ncbi:MULTISPECIES: hypothetical protein [Neobacillus]|uniref:Uncharacterized protein n=1 Tax=Neobacillus citreus TaxID=2833578 RepID=A0A942T8A8_9BACI|nr:hypothetical protein [Neobacillus citreus]MCH6267315.1 hypothetical protein [Neobacillus citreus]
MLNILVFVLIAVTLVLLSIFVDGLIELNRQEQEDKKQFVRDGLEGYMDQTFGIGRFKVFKTLLDSEGNIRYLVYLPKYEWLKAPTYHWYEVYEAHTGYRHNAYER